MVLKLSCEENLVVFVKLTPYFLGILASWFTSLCYLELFDLIFYSVFKLFGLHLFAILELYVYIFALFYESNSGLVYVFG